MRKLLTLIFILAMSVTTYAIAPGGCYVDNNLDIAAIALYIGGGFVISLIGCFIRLYSSKTVKTAANASRYIKGSVHIEKSSDIFLYRSVIKNKKTSEKERA